MWKDLGISVEGMKKGLDKGLDFVKKVAHNNVHVVDESVSIPQGSAAGQYVSYHLKYTPEQIGDDPTHPEDVEESVYLVPRPCPTTADVKSFFPIASSSFGDSASLFFRFKMEDEESQYVWLDESGSDDYPPTFRGDIHAQVLVCWGPRPIVTHITKPTNTTTKPSVLTAPPPREELVRIRQEAEAAKVRAAREFAQQNATDESNKRQSKLDSQANLSGIFDQWALTEQGKFKDVRSLLSSLSSVLWADSGWVDVPLGELMMSDACVKKSYRKAIILCHPDKHQSASGDQQYRADRIFNSINESYKLHIAAHPV